MNNVLVTGCSGFVGINLMQYFQKKDFNVAGVSLRKISRPDLVNIDYIVHLAGKAHDLRNTSAPDEYYTTNYGLTKELYDEFLISNSRKFIFISSVKACADHVEGILTEKDIPNPKTHYGKSKLMAEEYIQSQPLPPGKSFYILRPCMIHGAGNKGNLNLLYQLISKEIPYPLAAFENRRSFLSVENLCFVILELLERDGIPSGVYQVADDDALSTNEIIHLIALASNRNPRLWKINPGLIRILASIGDKLKLPLTTERLNKLTENYIVDNSKLRKALGKELPVKARDGIIQTIRSFQTQSK